MFSEHCQVVGIVSHDAGGAEILSSFVAQKRFVARYALSGPAISVFTRKLGDISITSLDHVLRDCDWLLCGTSWQSDLEWEAVRLACQVQKKVVSFLDHWVNFSHRFVRNGQIALPDEIWVGDMLAFSMAKALFCDTPIRLIDNPFFRDVEKEWAQKYRIPKTYQSTTRVLFVSDNIEECLTHQFGNGNLWGYTDRDSLLYLLSNLDRLGVTVDRVSIRPHPSEPSSNFSWAIDEYAPLVEMSTGHSLLGDLADHDIVVGSESMAMVIALLCGKRVVCSIPPSGKPCSLPHSEIEHLRDYIVLPHHGL